MSQVTVARARPPAAGRRLRGASWARGLAGVVAALLVAEALGRSGLISQSVLPLARLAGQLAESGPVPVRGVAMISVLLADGMSPLYHDACGDDLDDIIAQATRALSLGLRGQG